MTNQNQVERHLLKMGLGL